MELPCSKVPRRAAGTNTLLFRAFLWLFPWVQRMESEAAHSPPSSAELKVRCSCKLTFSHTIVDIKSLKTEHNLAALKILSVNTLKLTWE